ncbi:DUF4912 domain-containing protein [Litchfieldia alkalitelluris]|uniref:DUF4912 domain-containing protein n=1 Tax=Litchfieldia alkalitelluris TaxID=304268 RepID=UPI000997042B|nr:DUF4912 domain-containing protein [Litchfieldia alkalitelluris]
MIGEQITSNQSSSITNNDNQRLIDKINSMSKGMNVHSKLVHHEKLALMVKDDSTLYAYWDLPEVKKQIVEKHYGGKWADFTQAIKIYDITDVSFNSINEHQSLTIKIGDNKTYLFINNITPSRTYVAEIGVIFDDEPFFSLLRSNSVKSPFIQRNYNSEKQTSNNKAKWMINEQKDIAWKDSYSTYTCYES